MAETTRRSLLAIMGLAPASAVGSESFTSPAGAKQTVSQGYEKERFAKALERLAGELRSDRVAIISLNLTADLVADAIEDEHVLTLKFLYLPD